jgi:hypothetical protein
MDGMNKSERKVAQSTVNPNYNQHSKGYQSEGISVIRKNTPVQRQRAMES